MEAVAYQSLRDLQDRHWWFVGRRSVLTRLLSRLSLREGARILEAGCGYGGNLGMLARFGEVQAFELDESARRHASASSGIEIASGKLPDQVGFPGEAFELIVLLDVLEHIEEDVESLRALRERLAPGACIAVTVPAFPWLWSTHDEVHHHKRRYTRAGLRRALSEAGFEAIELGYFNSILFPLAVAHRCAARLLGRHGGTDAMPHPVLNRIFAKLFALERHWIGRVPLPPGLSLYAIARSPRFK